MKHPSSRTPPVSRYLARYRAWLKRRCPLAIADGAAVVPGLPAFDPESHDPRRLPFQRLYADE